MEAEDSKQGKLLKRQLEVFLRCQSPSLAVNYEYFVRLPMKEDHKKHQLDEVSFHFCYFCNAVYGINIFDYFAGREHNLFSP
jgi:hypothetical protein